MSDGTLIDRVYQHVLAWHDAFDITSILALVSTPWNLYNSPEVIAYFLGGLGALLGPFFGIMAIDYFAIRRERFSIRDMYLPNANSIYYYTGGVNPLALIAFVPAAAITLTLSLVDTFSSIAPFGWFIGAALGALFYLPLGRGRITVMPADLEQATEPSP